MTEESRQLVIPKSLASLNNDSFVPAIDNGFNYQHQYIQPNNLARLDSYSEIVRQSRYFYATDPIASIVINRMCEIAVTPLRVRKAKHIEDHVYTYYKTVAKNLNRFMLQAALEYQVNGMAVPQYTLKRQRIDQYTNEPSLGRLRVYAPDHIWCVDVTTCTIQRSVYGDERVVTINIPSEHLKAVKAKNREYVRLKEYFPDYVKMIEDGVKTLPTQSKPIMRKLMSYNLYPIPYLQPALGALRHKSSLKEMDQSIAQKAIEAVRHVRVGSDELPAIQDDIDAAEKSLKSQSAKNRIYNWITPHFYEMKWVYPPLDILTSETKYIEPNSDIFTALGFPRILTAGETLRSNTSDASIAIYGPRATMKDIRDSLLVWVTELFEMLADKNGFAYYPEPYFSPISETNTVALLQLAAQAMTNNTVSKDFIAQTLGTTYEDELNSIDMYQKDELKEQTTIDQENNNTDQTNNNPEENIDKSGKVEDNR